MCKKTRSTVYYIAPAKETLYPIVGDTSVTTTLSLVYDVYRNGLLQTETDDYTVSGAIYTFIDAFVADEKITFRGKI
jgi:hypothetical protein